MYETRTADGIEQVLAVHAGLPEAFLGFAGLADAVADQLAANGEGHGDFRVAFAIRDLTTGTDIGWSSTIIPARAPRQPF